MSNKQGSLSSPPWLPWLVWPIILFTGCCCQPPVVKRGALDGLVYRINHWQKNCGAVTKSSPMPSTISPTKSPIKSAETATPLIESPSGYLSEGPTLVGHTIAGPPGKKATDVVVELHEKIETLRAENQRLQTDLGSAEQEIQSQQGDLEAATKELRLAMNDLMIVREQLRRWEVGLSDLDAQYQSSQRRYDASLAELEHRLRTILLQWEADPEVGQGLTALPSTVNETLAEPVPEVGEPTP